MPNPIDVRAGDTEPISITLSATDLSDLTGLSTAKLYLRKDGESSNHVNGVTMTVPDTSALVVNFDPVSAKNGGGDALDASGQYRGYVLCTWSDADTTRHPADSDLIIRVRPNFE